MNDSEYAESRSEYRRDEISRWIVYELMADARTSSAPRISETVAARILDGHPLVVALEREGVITPHGDTSIRPDDVVTAFSPDGVDDRTVRAFIGSETTDPSSTVRTSREGTKRS